MNIVFFGSSEYSTIIQKALFENFGLSASVTIPDRITPKKGNIKSPVKLFANEHDIKVIEADKLTDEIFKQVQKLQPDFLVVSDYGLILPEKFLMLPKKKALNVHHSLLPKYRGPTPVPFAILNGEKQTGISIIEMTNKVDAGDVYGQKEYEMNGTETDHSLLLKLNELGAPLIVEVIKNFDSITPIKQDESKATFSKRFTKDDGYIDISDTTNPVELDRKIRAYYPWPGVWTRLQMANGKWQIVKFLPASPNASQGGPEQKIQVEGKKPVNYKDFVNGYPEVKGILSKLLISNS